MNGGDGVRCRSFRGKSGGREHHLSIVPQRCGDINEQLRDLCERYDGARRNLGLGPETCVFRRIFVSDVINQAPAVRASTLWGGGADAPVAVSLVQQPPLPDRKVALLAYHIEAEKPLHKSRVSANSVLVEKDGQRHLWTTGLCAKRSQAPASSPYKQTCEIFDALIKTLAENGGMLAEHCQRTWLYVKDVDTFYADMVEARGAVFAQQGLSGATHYIASTGIQGACADRYDVVAMDAYSNLDITPRQVAYLNDYDKLCDAGSYNVHFERGTRLSYADRGHLFISGTASIDRNGRVLHEGRVLPQLDRAIDNVEGLLKSGSAELSDLMHLIVYLRDHADYADVDAHLRARFGDLPMVIVEGPVCRPQWLIEIEGIAVAHHNDPSLPQF